MLKVIQPVNNLFKTGVNYHMYRLIKQSIRFDIDVAHAPYQMVKSTAVKNEGHNFLQEGSLLGYLFPSGGQISLRRL